MSQYIELTPAYGRDYRSAKEATAAFKSGQDWIGDFTLGFKPVNLPQIPIGSTVILRYKRNTQATTCKVTTHTLEAPAVPARASTKKPPSESTMMRWLNDGVAKAIDGCSVEPDGHCEHGKPSWLLRLGLI